MWEWTESEQMSDLMENSFKVAIINMFRELKETTIKEVKEAMMTMVHQTKNHTKETELFENQMKSLELESITTEI